jgi:hypothetical protein
VILRRQKILFSLIFDFLDEKILKFAKNTEIYKKGTGLML